MSDYTPFKMKGFPAQAGVSPAKQPKQPSEQQKRLQEFSEKEQAAKKEREEKTKKAKETYGYYPEPKKEDFDIKQAILAGTPPPINPIVVTKKQKRSYTKPKTKQDKKLIAGIERRENIGKRSVMDDVKKVVGKLDPRNW